MVTAAQIEAQMAGMADETQRRHLMRFFKTAEGQYGFGDEFLGLKVPQTRAVVKQLRNDVSLPEIEKLLYSRWHEVRLAGFLLLVEQMKALKSKTDAATAEKRAALAAFYLRHARQANNWDLVDLSCPYILGPYLRLTGAEDYSLLHRLADSDNLWEQRIAVVTTLDLIRNGIFTPTFEIADKLMAHPHDLIHKAIGWVLREVGKKDRQLLVDYLEVNYHRMPRTSLRYAIEHFPEPERKQWLKRPRT
ncbi:MAG: DNA alkylation repair protein [Muribaculaceae bacterium]|nr:DNA alkylation repair protein [Muribaculaceae bacterium]